jgi:hypothetical protein
MTMFPPHKSGGLQGITITKSVSMSEPAIEVKDPSRIRCLIVPACPNTRSPPNRQPGPLEMATRSIQFPTTSTAALMKAAPSSCILSVDPVAAPPGLLVPGWFVQAGYAFCGLAFGLCNLIAPGYIQACAHLLCPVWTLALTLHIITVQSEPGRAWGGILTLCLLPFVILVGSSLFVGFYLLVFAVFASGMFWRRLQGAHFLLVWLCWAGFFLACGLGFGTVPVQMHLSVAAFFAIAIGILNSGGTRLVISVSV